MKLGKPWTRALHAGPRIATLYRVELAKTMRLRQTYVGPLLVLLVVLASPLAHPVAKDEIGDYAFIAYVTPLALNVLGYVLLLIFVGGLMASDLERGTLRSIALRPVLRSDIYLAKLLVGCSYSVVLTLTTGVASWGVAGLLGDLHGVQIGGDILFTSDQMARTYFIGALLALVPQWAGVSLGLLYSTIARNTTAAISLSIGTWVALDVLKYPLGISDAVFTSYLEAPWRVFAAHCDGLMAPWWPVAAYGLLSSGVVAVGTTCLGLWVFNRRNLGSW